MKQLTEVRCNNLRRISSTKRGFGYKYYLGTGRVIDKRSSFFIPARHWNSDHPIIPTRRSYPVGGEDIQAGVGGGYFLAHGGKGIAIDPGYRFLEVLYHYHGLTIKDIDYVLSTHNHADHHADLENILITSRDAKQTIQKIFLSRPTHLYYKYVLTPHMIEYCSPGQNWTIDCENDYYIKIKPLPSLHWQDGIEDCLKELRKELPLKYPDFISYQMEQYGSLLELESPKNINQRLKSILITSDTLFPVQHPRTKKFLLSNYEQYLSPDKKYIHWNSFLPVDRPSLEDKLFNYFQRFLDAYKGLSADIVCFHIGSLENHFCNIKYSRGLTLSKLNDIQYDGHHLGLLGSYRLFSHLNSRDDIKMVILTEWGEELKGQRKNISSLFELWTEKPTIPSDIGLYIDLREGLVRCDTCGQSHLYTEIGCDEREREYIRYRSRISEDGYTLFERNCDWQLEPIKN